MAILIHTHCVY